jgi:hypothetical protein
MSRPIAIMRTADVPVLLRRRSGCCGMVSRMISGANHDRLVL